MTFIVGDLLGSEMDEGWVPRWRGLSAVAGHPGTAAPVGDHGPHEPAAACPDHLQVQMLPRTSDLPQPPPWNRRRLPSRGRGDRYRVAHALARPIGRPHRRVRAGIPVLHVTCDSWHVSV